MPTHAEKELDAFLAGLPSYQRKYLEQGYSSLTREDSHQFDEWFRKSEECRSAPNPDEELIAVSLPGIARRYALLLAQAPVKLKERRERYKREGLSTEIVNLLLPKSKAGRKKNDAVFQQIWELHAAGKTSREIQQALKESGVSLGLEGVEYYLKSRRLPQP